MIYSQRGWFHSHVGLLFIYSTFLLLLDSDHFSCCSAVVSLAAWLVFGSKIIWLQKKNNPLFHNETEC